MEEIKKLISKGFELHKNGDFKGALKNYLKVDRSNNANSTLLFLIGNVYLQLNEIDNSINYFKKSISKDPNNISALNNLGGALQRNKKYKEAINVYEKAIKIKPDHIDALTNLANSQASLKKFSEAITYYKKIIEINPDNFVIYNNLGKAFEELNNIDEAIKNYKKSIKLKPDYYLSYNNLGNVYQNTKNYYDALKCYEKILSLKPDFDYILGKIIHTNMLICNWTGFNKNIDILKNSLKKNHKVITPFSILSLIDDPEYHKMCSKIYSDEKFGKTKKELLKNKIESKIKIGYFSPDFRNHPILKITKDIFKNHDKSKFEIFAFSFTPKEDEMTQTIKNYFTKFVDINQMSDEQVAKYCKEIGIDIAIDMCGYTGWNRAELFSHQVAPIQINYLGYSGTMCTKFMDFIIADKTIIPSDDKKYYSEKIIYLPNCWLPNLKNISISEKEFKRVDLNLPNDAFIFCNFNTNYKITPIIFDLWMNILKEVPNSILWLFESNFEASKNLQKEAENYGISQNRLIFLRHLPYEEHLKILKLGDLFLDTFPYNAHATAVDALRVGLPVLTLMGRTFASRVAGSILKQINLNELITENREKYKKKAIELAKNTNKLFQIKKELTNTIQHSPLLDSVKFTKDLENIYINLVQEKST